MPLPILGLPFDSNGEADIIAHCTRITTESVREQRKWVDFVQQNRNLYETGTVHGQPADDDMIVHEIQVHVISSVVVQMREPPRPKLEPVETGEPATYYWAGPQEIGIGLGLPPECVADFIDPMTGQMSPPMPLDQQVGEQLFYSAVSKEQAFAQQQAQAVAVQQGAMQGVAVPQQPIIRQDWIVAQDDQLVSDVYQSVLDVLWRRSKVDLWIRKNLLNTNIDGTAWGLFEFDKPSMKFVLKHLPFMQTHIDPQAADIKDANYAGFDLVYDADEARASFPGLRQVIDAEAHTSNPRSLGDALWSGEQNINYEREIIEFRVFWIRHQTACMTEQEALESGKVQQTEVPLGATQPGSLDLGNLLGGNEYAAADSEDGATEKGEVDDDGMDDGVGVSNTGPAGDAGGVGGGDGQLPASADDNSERSEVPPASGPGMDGASGGGQPQLSTRTVLLNIQTGEEVTPAHPAWPTKPAIAQVTIIGNRVVGYAPCGFADIPILHNLNVPTAGSTPYGIGEPYRLRNLQRAMSGTLGSMVENAAYHANPVSVMSKSMAASLPEDVRRNGHARPGMIIEVPDDQYIQYQGKIQTVQDPPAMPPALGELYPLLKGTIDQLSGNTPTMRGNAPSANASGKMVELLQESGADMMWARGSRTADMVERMAELMLHEIVFGLDPEDVYRIISKYPPHVLAAIHKRARNIEWNVLPNVEAGNAGLKMQKRQTAQLDMQAGVLSAEGYAEQVGVDYRVEKPRLKEQMAEQAQAAAAMAPPQEPGNGSDKQRKPAA